MSFLTVKNPVKSTQQGTLPNLIIIGAMKCGTTSLHHYLNLHPQISMSSEKELKFFVREENWRRGVEWYKSHFTTSADIQGESSPAYTKYPFFQGVPERMYSVVPNAKLIYIMRDPIERIISHYVHRYAVGNESKKITDALAEFENNYYIVRSLYYLQLKQYLAYFSESNIFLLTLEELSKNPQENLQKIFRFLNVDDTYAVSCMTKKYHESGVKRRKNNWGEWLAKAPIINQINNLPSQIQWHLENLIYLPFSQKIEKPQLDDSLRIRLINYLKKDINNLKNYMGRDLEDWCI